MCKKRRILFNLFSFLFLITLVVFYGYRLFYFYKLEHTASTDGPVKFSELLINNAGIEGMNYGLQKTDDGYYFETKSVDNYLLFLGRTWRIIGVDNENNIKAITEEVQTLLSWKEDASFEESDIYTWLKRSDVEHSGIFEESLKQNTYIKDISLLTKQEYQRLKENNFLIGENFWIIDEKPSFIDNKGELQVEEDNNIYGVRPVITLSSDVLYISGSGTETNPYIISSDVKEKLNDTYVGEYLTYNDNLWRIIEVNDTSTKVVLDSSLEDDTIFGSSNNEFNLKSGIGNYLNNDFYETLLNEDYIIEKDFYIGTFENKNNYSYLNTYENSVKVKIGLYKIGDFFINSENDIYTLSPSTDSKEAIYTIRNKKLFVDLVTNAHKIKPVIYLDSDIFIIKGDGTKNNPYEIGR